MPPAALNNPAAPARVSHLAGCSSRVLCVRRPTPRCLSASRTAQVAGTFHLHTHTHTHPSCLLHALPWDVSHQELPLEVFQTSVFIGLPTGSKNTEYYFTASSNLHMLRENGSASVNETISITPGQFQLTQKANTSQLGSDGCK